MPLKRTFWLSLSLSICLVLSACKVIYTTPEASSEGEKSASVSSTASTTPYSVQSGTPVYIANLSTLGCTWQGVAGQAFNSSGQTVDGLIVKVGGNFNGATFTSSGVTGSSAAYGPGGYEVDLISDGSPIASTNTLWIQLYNASGVAVSGKYYFSTYADCSKNLAIINFNMPGEPQLYFPIIYR